jgi:hypothetical protein
MAASSTIHEVFGHFQNLNLLGLLHDLRDGRAARQAWLSGNLLCPIAHGLPAGQHVREVACLGQINDLESGCDYAARHLGADPHAVLRFVRSWDEGLIGRDWLTRQLEEMWQERLADAEFWQELLQQESGEVQQEAGDESYERSGLSWRSWSTKSADEPGLGSNGTIFCLRGCDFSPK